MGLRAYQELAADFLYETSRAMVLAPVGAGKTATALTAMRDMLRDGHVKRFLVLAPLRVCTDVWAQEAEIWTPELHLAIAVGAPKQRQAAFWSDAKIVVTNYDNLKTLDATGFDGIVFDELTRLKNSSGVRFKALKIDHINVRWGLTGSFTSNGLEDVFGQCKAVDPELLGRRKGVFMQQYFVLINRDYGEWAPLPGSLEQVMQRIKPATFLLDPGDYKDKLPPLHVVPIRFDLPDRYEYEKMKKEFVVEFPDAVAVAANAGVVVNKLQQMASGFVYDTQTLPGATPGTFNTKRTPIFLDHAKLDELEELLAENQRANTIIVYQYGEELARLRRQYPQAVTLDDPDAIARWNAGKVELLLVHPKSAGHGLNLQHGGCRVVFFSLPWSLELYEQTIGRLHRSGQKHDVWCYVLLARNTVDEQVWAALKDKRNLSDIAMESLK